MKIRTDLDFLHQPCTDVKIEERGALQSKLHIAMREYRNRGHAIAANQIGIKKRAFVMQEGRGKFKFFINPVLLESFDEYDHQEGCLSLPGQGSFSVRRFMKIRVSDDLHGEVELTGLPAAIWQHEVDHLNGKLICD